MIDSRTVFTTGLITLILLPTIAYSAPALSVSKSWARTYGGTFSEEAYSVVQTSDGGFMVAGQTNSFGSTHPHFWVLRLDEDGTVVWERAFTGIGGDAALSAVQTSDGGFAVAGTTGSFGAGRDFWVLRLDEDGTVVWENAYGGPGSEVAYSLVQTSDGGFIVAGYSIPFGGGDADFLVLRLDEDGGVAWEKAYGGPRFDTALSVIQVSDGDFIAAGNTNSFGAGDYDFWVLRLDESGSVVWDKTFGGPNFEELRSLGPTSDGGFIIGGSSVDGYWVLRLDADASVVWEKSYNAPGFYPDEVYSVGQTPDEGFIVAGTENRGFSDANFWLLRLNTDGGVEWERKYGGPLADEAFSAGQTSDGGFIVAGRTNSFGQGTFDILVLRLDANGLIETCSLQRDISHGPTVTDTEASSGSSGATGAETGVQVTATTAVIIETSAIISILCPAATERAMISVSTFFTDSSLNPLFLDQFGNPRVDVVLARGVVRSTNPGEVLAWVKVANEAGAFESLKVDVTLPADWTVHPSWMKAGGGIHVYFEFADSSRVEVEDLATITIRGVNPQTVSLTISDLTATVAGLGPRESILLAVKLKYSLRGFIQPATTFPHTYTATATATGYTMPSFTAESSTDNQSGYFIVYARTFGDTTD